MIVIKIAYDGWKMKRGKLPRYLVKTGLILVVTSVALILQVVNLLYITFNSQISPGFATAIYYVVELIPAYLLFFLFAPDNAAREKNSLKGSTQMKSKDDIEMGGTLKKSADKDVFTEMKQEEKMEVVVWQPGEAKEVSKEKTEAAATRESREKEEKGGFGEGDSEKKETASLNYKKIDGASQEEDNDTRKKIHNEFVMSKTDI